LQKKTCGIEHQLVENFQNIEHQLRDRISAMEQYSWSRLKWGRSAAVADARR